MWEPGGGGRRGIPETELVPEEDVDDEVVTTGFVDIDGIGFETLNAESNLAKYFMGKISLKKQGLSAVIYIPGVAKAGETFSACFSTTGTSTWLLSWLEPNLITVTCPVDRLKTMDQMLFPILQHL